MLRTAEKELGLTVDSARLDRYYSYQSALKYFDNETVLHIIPKAIRK